MQPLSAISFPFNEEISFNIFEALGITRSRIR